MCLPAVKGFDQHKPDVERDPQPKSLVILHRRMVVMAVVVMVAVVVVFAQHVPLRSGQYSVSKKGHMAFCQFSWWVGDKTRSSNSRLACASQNTSCHQERAHPTLFIVA